MDIICILSRVALVDIDIALCNLRVCTLAAANDGKKKDAREEGAWKADRSAVRIKPP